MVACACHSSYFRKHKQEELSKKQDPISKITRSKRTGDMA
jgi:hypothetical protein